jgi:hypothetical protein
MNTNQIFFFDISRIDVVEAVQAAYKVHPNAIDKFSLSREENGDGFYLNFPKDCPAEWIYQVGFEYAEIIRRKNPFTPKS